MQITSSMNALRKRLSLCPVISLMFVLTGNRPTKEPYSHLVRFSYGPNRRTVATALSRMAEVIREHR